MCTGKQDACSCINMLTAGKVGDLLVGRRRVAAAVGHEQASAEDYITHDMSFAQQSRPSAYWICYHRQPQRAISLPVDEQNLRIAHAMCVS